MGRDLQMKRLFISQHCFNPRARVGRDLNQRDELLAEVRFNPRARVGRDPVECASLKPAEGFQSTRPRGARLDSGGFDSCDLPVSIHAPAWGATIQGTWEL